jgi:hypothetical protein
VEKQSNMKDPYKITKLQLARGILIAFIILFCGVYFLNKNGLMDESSWILIWLGVPIFSVIMLFSFKFAKKHYSDLLNDKDMPPNKLLRVWYIQYKTIYFIAKDIKEYFSGRKMQQQQFEIKDIYASRNSAEAGMVISLLKSNGFNPLELDTSSHVGFAGADQFYYVRIPINEYKEAKVFLAKQGFNNIL